MEYFCSLLNSLAEESKSQNMTFPPVPPLLPPNMPALLVQLAHVWAESPGRPRPKRRVLEHWDRLIDAWVDDLRLPLYVRKPKNRGSEVAHASGRILVPTDNSPAQWALACAITGQMPTLSNIRAAIKHDKIPVAMVLESTERTTAKYLCTLGKSISPNAVGWTVCHIEGVRMTERAPLPEIKESIFREHFRRLMAPSNMFLIPKKYAGLGELPEFCEAIRCSLGPA